MEKQNNCEEALHLCMPVITLNKQQQNRSRLQTTTSPMNAESNKIKILYPHLTCHAELRTNCDVKFKFDSI